MYFQLIPRIGRTIVATMILGAVALAAPAASNAEDTPVTKAMPAHSPIETHIKSLHSALRITAAQEQQWQAVADAMRDSAKNVGALIRDRAANLKTMTAIDDLHSYEAIADAHAAGVKALIPSFEVLYATMSDAQKKNADAVFRHRPRPTVLKTNG